MDEEKKLPLFKAFRYQSTRFLGVRRGNDGLHIVDEHGNNYGVWSSVERFRKQLQEPGGATAYGINVRLEVWSDRPAVNQEQH